LQEIENKNNIRAAGRQDLVKIMFGFMGSPKIDQKPFHYKKASESDFADKYAHASKRHRETIFFLN
jgi:hypothetical protein